ncbi:MAG: glycosyltransferase [Sphingobium sp.]
MSEAEPLAMPQGAGGLATTGRTIGYYVHHHGAGHLTRARAIAEAAAGRIVLLGTGIGPPGVNLADDRRACRTFDGADGSENRPDALHYAPLDHDGIRSRVATIAQWVEAHKPSLMVVDVSVEVAMLARLASVPVVYVRLNGDRTDLPHLEAFRGAAGLLAPFHRDLECSTTLPWVREKTRYLPGITRKARVRSDHMCRTILVVVGRGGQAGDGEIIARTAARCPEWHWRVIGPCSAPRHHPSNLDLLGWIQDPEQAVADAHLVVGAAGDGLVGSVLAANRPFICLPEDRPFDEQRATARGLGAAGAAVVLSHWPEPERWPGLIVEALALPDEARRTLHDPHGADAAARWLCEMASASHTALEKAA